MLASINSSDVHAVLFVWCFMHTLWNIQRWACSSCHVTSFTLARPKSTWHLKSKNAPGGLPLLGFLNTLHIMFTPPGIVPPSTRSGDYADIRNSGDAVAHRYRSKRRLQCLQMLLVPHLAVHTVNHLIPFHVKWHDWVVHSPNSVFSCFPPVEARGCYETRVASVKLVFLYLGYGDFVQYLIGNNSHAIKSWFVKNMTTTAFQDEQRKGREYAEQVLRSCKNTNMQHAV